MKSLWVRCAITEIKYRYFYMLLYIIKLLFETFSVHFYYLKCFPSRADERDQGSIFIIHTRSICRTARLVCVDCRLYEVSSIKCGSVMKEEPWDAIMAFHCIILTRRERELRQTQDTRHKIYDLYEREKGRSRVVFNAYVVFNRVPAPTQ